MDATHAIPRHRTAITRSHLSKPITLALADGLITAYSSLFDYGCGRGHDVTRLRALGYDAHGWDPGHRPTAEIRPADVVNLGYVVNVIEDPAERALALQTAWSLARDVLIVAARPSWEERTVTGKRHGDGILTTRGTFQKFFTQEGLQAWIQGELQGSSCVAAAPGIFYVFRDEGRAQSLLASRVRQRSAPVRQPKVRQALYDAHRQAMDRLHSFIAARGRLPEPWELNGAADQLGAASLSIKQAAAVLRQVIGPEEWNKDVDAARTRAQQDLLVYLALAAFTRRPRASSLPRDIALDIKAVFGSYRTACDSADQLLRRVADQGALNAACGQSRIGKLTSEALYVHVAALHLLAPLLRVYEGCARILTGTVADANIIKLSRTGPKVSYLSYPDFDRHPHPALATSLRADLSRIVVKYLDFRESTNPPVLHRKETFVPIDYPHWEKFARLTRQEERAGLLEASTSIGTREGWQARLDEYGYRLQGHRLIRQLPV
ncbi:DNA phosphorothioation-associated putative methyltransferase [Micromonospora aurantiaca (nom. illeg.)]|uniref:DNA phosphorothioation-associated putative methyltransferase n=1 Tax=Micromonospora aurantiaca (nom. illeg.) TaxID=47850 RepID=UPI00378ABE4A